jgi:HAD superfamily hydrolase (TIGR01484 family)
VKPLSEFAPAARAGIRGVFLDIDDTLTTQGRLTADAYSALEQLKRQGPLVIPVTGRSAGWCDHIARMWPVDGVVGENGAFYFTYDTVQHKLLKRFVSQEKAGDEERAARKGRLAEIAAHILREVPGCALASDQGYREADIAIDFCEDVPPLPRAAIERIATLMREAGLTAKISSIHVNGWFGGYDKLSTAMLFMQERFGIDLDSAKDAFVFVGDSPNDAPMFGYFPYAVGVANVRDFIDTMPALPAFVTEKHCGEGFAEVVKILTEARSGRQNIC